MIISRFAPSPTGTSGMHIGNLRTALYSYLYAKQNNGKFILRIEDTDKERSNDLALNDIHNILNMFNIIPDEEYIQSKRLSIYRYYAHKLIAMGYAYACTCTDNEEYKDCKCRLKPDIDPITNCCIRLSIPWYKSKQNFEYDIVLDTVSCYDQIRKDKINIKYEELYDIVLLKSDGYPTYHLASVVDDHLMNITDIFRGDEWLSSFPYHIILYNAFKWNIPKFYHLPLITNDCGEKLSKRDGDFSVKALLSKGILPSAILNYIALLGWHPSGNDEIFNMDKLLKDFSVERLSKSSACYDEKKLNKFNLIHSRTDIGKKEFKLMLNNKDDILLERLYIIFKDGININELISNINNSSSVIDWTPRLNEFFKSLSNLIYRLPYVNHAAELITDSDIDKILSELEIAGYSRKEINEWIRLALTGSVIGLPARTLLGILYTVTLTFKIRHYIL